MTGWQHCFNRMSLADAAAPPPPPPSTSCTVFDLQVNKSYSYCIMPGATHALVPLDTVLKVSDLPHGKCVIQLPPLCLPFGFLESVSVLGTSPSADIPDLRLSITKTTGQRSSLRTRRTVPCMSPEMNNDNDAADDTYAVLKKATGHNLKFRMLPAAIILNMVVEFYGYPPPSFFIVYHGANAVPASQVADLPAALRARGPVDFLFKAIAPSARLKLAMDLATAGDGGSGVGSGSGFGAGAGSASGSASGSGPTAA